MLSPDYFKNQFIETFGTICYYLQQAGLHFAVVLLIKFIIDCVTVTIRTCEINKLSKNTTNVGKVFLSAVFNVFYVTALTNMFRAKTEQDEKAEQKRKEIFDQQIEAIQSKFGTDSNYAHAPPYDQEQGYNNPTHKQLLKDMRKYQKYQQKQQDLFEMEQYNAMNKRNEDIERQENHYDKINNDTQKEHDPSAPPNDLER